ncbi:non-homologous end-joining DNA ligase [bacterium]|nr:non-homologous end-joining DNA ligase [bacterium]
MPSWMDPMLAKLTHDYFSGDDWIFERKLDGERVIAYVHPDGTVDLMSRNKKHINDSYPEIESALEEHAQPGCILDGEMVAFNENDVTDFQKLQPRMHVSSRQESLDSDVKVFYYIFDCMYAYGHDITQCKLRSRKKILRQAVKFDDPLRWEQYRIDDGLKYYREACEKGWEGLIAKHIGSTYEHKRSSDWLKFKCIKQQEFVIGGFTDPHGSRIGFGALLLGFYRDGELTYAGEVGTGFDDETLGNLHDELAEIEVDQSPYDSGVPPTKEVHFVKPEKVCEIVFSQWTDANRLRHPRFKGMRRDKAPTDVHKEDESEVAELDEVQHEN